ncbi:MAG: hypothetical protein ACYS9X_18520 [Planctomycetota bacterium]|jgi:hypothetical protein
MYRWGSLGAALVTFVTLSCLAAGCGAKREPGGPGPDVARDAAKAGADAEREPAWQDTFDLDTCTLLTAGRNRFFILEPDYRIVLADGEGDEKEEVFITVLDETEVVDGVETRVVEEREFLGGELKEVSRNFFTICREHLDVFYHGEDVDNYKGGEVVGHGGAWRAGVKGARPGLMMAGKVEVGARYYQEVAPGVAMDRAENVRVDETVQTPGGTFADCLRVVETTPLEPGSESIKVYAPGVGMIVDDDLKLASYGKRPSPPAPPAAADKGAGAPSIRAAPPVADAPAPAAAAAPGPPKRRRAPKGKPASEVEIEAGEMPKAVAAAVAKLYPTGRIHEVKRETHKGGEVVYAIEVFIGGKQYDIEATADGTVLRNEAE